MIFFRPGQDFSRLALKELAGVQKELAGKSIRWVGIVSDRAAKDDVQAMVKESGISMLVLIDVGDAFYGKLGVAQVPVTVLFDEQHKLVAYQSFTKVNYAAVVTARVRYLLKGNQRRGTGGGAEPAGCHHRQRRGSGATAAEVGHYALTGEELPQGAGEC